MPSTMRVREQAAWHNGLDRELKIRSYLSLSDAAAIGLALLYESAVLRMCPHEKTTRLRTAGGEDDQVDTAAIWLTLL